MGLTKEKKTMVIVLIVGAFIAVLNQTLLTPALPTIMGDLNVGATTVQWLTSGYSLVEAVIIPLNAFLLGRFSTRRLFIGSISLFTLGSVVCALAPSFSFLFLGRICQATATGVMMPTVFALILMIFPRESRGSAMGLIGLIVSFAPAVGPSISGALVDSIGWRALFVLVACISLLIVIASAWLLKNFEGFEPTSFDLLSVVLMALGMIGLLYGLSTFTTSDNPAIPVALMIAGAVLLVLFARRQVGLEEPVLNVRVLANRNFRIAVIVIALMEATLVGSSVLLPLFIQNALGDSATVSGLLMLPGASCGAICGLIAGRLFDRHGIRTITVVGSFILVFGVFGYFGFTQDTSNLMVGIVYTIACCGLQFLITPINTWGINSLPNSKVPHGNAIISTFEQVGSSFGTAFVVSLTALWYLLVPASASGAQQTFAGCHIAFLGIIALSVAIMLIIVIFVRDKRADETAPGEKAQGLPGIDRPWLVGDLMNTSPNTLGIESTVRDAISIMRDTETSGLPIVDGAGAVVGFISDGDILKHLAQHKNTRLNGASYHVLLDSESLQDRLDAIVDKPVLELATKNVISVNVDDDAERAFKRLSERHIKKMPVMRGGKFVGTLSRRNIMKAIPIMGGRVAK
jgi:DHA2 family multidrug resistance protein-like MFS transporter